MAASHKRRETRIKPLNDLRKGRESGCRLMVTREDYPKLLQMSREGYMNSEIGRAFGVSGSTAGRLIRRYQAVLQ
jgi:DNA-binding NarL/FixJ family response regulator